MLQELKWLMFPEIINYNKIVLMDKIISSSVSPYCLMLLKRGMAQRQDRYNTRERDLRIAWRCKTVRRGEKSFMHSALKLFNHSKVAGRGLDKLELKEFIKDKLIKWRK